MVEVTTNGAVPVATFEINCGAVILAVASTCAVPKLFTFALPVTLRVLAIVTGPVTLAAPRMFALVLAEVVPVLFICIAFANG